MMVQEPFLLAQVEVDLSQALDLHLLRALYLFFTYPSQSLTAADLLPPPRDRPDLRAAFAALPAVGPHWERIGFQGLDPRTDLNRAMKMLAVLQMLHLVEAAPAFARRLFQQASDSSLLPAASINSQSKGQGRLRAVDRSWPLMCVSIMLTKEALVALRSGTLNAEINKAKAVMPVLHDLHHALFAEFSRYPSPNPDLQP